MIVQYCKIIQKPNCALFYKYSKELNGYFIAGILIKDTLEGRLDFVSIWKYFIQDIVLKDDIYCSLFFEEKANILEQTTTYHTTIDGVAIYKVENYLQNINK